MLFSPSIPVRSQPGGNGSSSAHQARASPEKETPSHDFATAQFPRGTRENTLSSTQGDASRSRTSAKVTRALGRVRLRSSAPSTNRSGASRHPSDTQRSHLSHQLLSSPKATAATAEDGEQHEEPLPKGNCGHGSNPQVPETGQQPGEQSREGRREKFSCPPSMGTPPRAHPHCHHEPSLPGTPPRAHPHRHHEPSLLECHHEPTLTATASPPSPPPGLPPQRAHHPAPGQVL